MEDGIKICLYIKEHCVNSFSRGVAETRILMFGVHFDQ